MRKKRVLFCSEATFLNTGYATYAREILNYLHSTGKYDIAELAAYGEQNDPRAANIPWGYYGVVPNHSCEPKAPQEMVDAYHRKQTNQFGEWAFEQVCLDFLPDFVCDIRDFWMCLTKNSTIMCKNGVKKISNIKVGDKVLSHTGKYQKVLRTFKREYFGDLHTINVMNCPFDVELTDGHPVYCLKRKNANSLPIDKFHPGNLEWINSEKVEKNDILVFPIDQGKHAQSPALCRLFGYYMAEGCIMYEGLKEDNKIKGVQWTFNASETNHINDLVELVKSLYNKDVKVKVIGNTAVLRCFNRQIGEDCLLHCGSLAGEKILSPQFFLSSDRCIREFLCGLFRGDGGYYKNRASYCTKSKQLAYQVFRLCLRLGILPSFNLNKNKIEGIDKDYWRYIFSFRSKALGGFETIYNNKVSTPIVPSKRIKNGYAWLTVKDVILQTYGTDVYNFEVEEDNTYVSSFCVHNCDHEERSPFRPYFNWVTMPTVDARPQARQWIATYSGADACLSYSDWAGGILKDQSGGKINYLGSAPPSAHPAYKPVEDKIAHKESYGLNPEYKIIGTVMRNQRRKLYPDLFEAFRKFLDKSKSKKYYLYCHTSYPDMGWDIPELLQQHELSSHVLFTYVCPETKKPFVSIFKGAATQSPYTGKWGSTLSNVRNGLTYEELSDVVNLFDLYVQYANSEGFGLPQVEAAACGVPVCGTDYSAMESVLRKLEGYPIKPAALYKELETGCFRAVPDNEAAAEFFLNFFERDKNDEDRAAVGERTRNNFKKYYQWDISGSVWERYFDSVELKPFNQTWGSPPRIHQPEPKLEVPKNSECSSLAKWLIVNVLKEPDKLNTFFEARITRDLIYHQTTGSTGGMYFNESSAVFDGTNNRQEFNFDIAYDNMKHICERRNHWEQKRIEKTQKLGNQ